MKILEVFRKRFTDIQTPPLSLKEAQVVEGKITKIYPQNKAEIQIGPHRMIAEVSTPLVLGQRYFFEVQGMTEPIHLKVIAKSGKTSSESAPIHILLQQLGINQTKANTLLVKKLVQGKMQIDPTQVKLATQLLEKIGSKPANIELVKELIVQNLPISEAAFYAQQTKKAYSVGELLANLMTLLQKQEVLQGNEYILLRQLENLQVQPVRNNNELVQQMLRVHPSENMLTLLQLLHLIRPNIETSQLTEILKKNETIEGSIKSIVQHENSMVGVKSLEQALGKLSIEASQIEKVSLKLLAIFPNLRHIPLTAEQMVLLKNTVVTELFPLIPETAKEMLTNEFQTSNQSKLHQILHFLSQIHRSPMILEALNTVVRNQDNTFIQSQVTEQFISHLKNYLNQLGMHDEYILKQFFEQSRNYQQQVNNEQMTIKSLLLQLINQASGSNHQIREQAQSLIHFIHGMQMQAIVESGNILQATLQIPSKKLGLHEDIFMQFEGQKTSNGQINPDYCRIFFVLQLHHLKETMIDMHVQKRVISITVFNDKIGHAPLNDSSIKALLKEKLTNLNYQLSSVTWKPLYQDQEETNRLKTELTSAEMANQREGFDYKI